MLEVIMLPMPTNITVIKANGEREPFNLEKVVTSLKRVGASDEEIRQVIKKLNPQLKDNMPTNQIYGIVYSLLDQELGRKPVANRYSLKKAIFDLGPTGYPFEQFIAGLLEESGYTCLTNQVINGACVQHEIDIVAKKQDEELLIEAKFHGNQGYKTKIQTALYVWARFLDISNQSKTVQKPWLITNTKLTSQVKDYARCNDLKVTSWNYPHGESLREIVDKSKLHPITSLSSLDTFSKNNLLKAGVVFCRDIKDHANLFRSPKEHNRVLEEVKALCGE